MPIRTYRKNEDTQEVLTFFNNKTKYAPFSVPLTEQYLHNYVLESCDQERIFYCLYTSDEKISGIIHFGLNPRSETEGHIHLLLGDTTQICMELLEYGQKILLSMHVSRIIAFSGHPNPYQFFLYGAENYCWAGLYPTNNAFRHLGYDITLDIVVMSLSRKTFCNQERKINPVFHIEEKIIRNNEVTRQGELVAYDKNPDASEHNNMAGRSGYCFLKALTERLGKGYGQINIWINDEYQGKNIGRSLMQTMHQRLFDSGVERIILATNQELFRAIKFYEGLGYKQEAVRGYWYSKEIIAGC